MYTTELNTKLSTKEFRVKSSLIKESEQSKTNDTTNQGERYEFGTAGIARIFNCSLSTANKIKSTGRIKSALYPMGRRIIIDVKKALELNKQYNKRKLKKSYSNI